MIKSYGRWTLIAWDMYQELLHIKVDNSPRSDELHLDVAWNGAFLERLDMLWLFSLEHRRLRSDGTEVCKIMTAM